MRVFAWLSTARLWRCIVILCEIGRYNEGRRSKNSYLVTVPRHGDCSKSPHRPVEYHPAARTASSRASTTWLVGLASPTLAAQLTSGRSERYGGCAGRCALRVVGPIQTVPCRPDRRESTVESRCGSDLAVPTCSGAGRSLATRPRAVAPGEWPEGPPARGDRHPARIRVRQGPQLQLLAQARRPLSVHPADLRLGLPSNIARLSER
jgi:hypothetical protein